MSFGAIAQALWSSKRRIIAPTLLMTAAAFIAVNLLTPKYKSEARVLVEARENIFLRPEAEKALLAADFHLLRSKGSHRIYAKG